jgi:AcrR family transcriptional regulator
MEQPRRRGRTSDAERADRRNEILDVAVDSFREVGFARTTIDAIATAAGVAKRTVYSYFGDKSAVFAAAVSRQHAYVENAGGDQSDLLAAAVDIVVALHSDNSIALHRMMIGEAVQFPGTGRRVLRIRPGQVDCLSGEDIDRSARPEGCAVRGSVVHVAARGGAPAATARARFRTDSRTSCATCSSCGGMRSGI